MSHIHGQLWIPIIKDRDGYWVGSEGPMTLKEARQRQNELEHAKTHAKYVKTGGAKNNHEAAARYKERKSHENDDEDEVTDLVDILTLR
jgi:hypothetical protein